MRNMNLRIELCLFLALIFVITSLACRGSQRTVSNSPSQTTSSTQSAQPAQTVQTAPSPGLNQNEKKSAAKDGVPEIMKRALTKEEMEKAMEQMPPQVRAQLKGMAPKAASPTPTPTPRKK